MKKINKYLYLFVVQGYFYGTWEDLTQSENYNEARADLKDYRINDPKYVYHIIHRRELNEEAQ